MSKKEKAPPKKGPQKRPQNRPAEKKKKTKIKKMDVGIAVREIAAGKRDADFEAKYPKLAKVLECVRYERDEAKRESVVAFVEELVALAAQEDRERATKEAAIKIFNLCAPKETREKLESALATKSEEYCDAQIDLLARSFAEHDEKLQADGRLDGRTAR